MLTKYSTPLRSIKERSDRALALSDLSFVYLKRVDIRMVRKLCFWQGALLPSGERLARTEPAGETARGPVDLGNAPTVAKRRPTLR